MLGNWSFGDYFKKEAIAWAWELVVVAWKFPPARIYATVFCPYLGQPGWEEKWKADFDLAQSRLSQKQAEAAGEAATFDESAADIDAIRFWMQQFQHARLDARVHIVPGGKKDNFWMMGETGPCGPCSELHVDLTPNGDTKGSLVNKGDARCIEIWNLVFIQFNANPDGTFSPLPARHVDTGMGFERVASIIQGTQRFTDFANARISNYETDIFRPIFDKLEQLSGKRYASTLPGAADGSSKPADGLERPADAVGAARQTVGESREAVGGGSRPVGEGSEPVGGAFQPVGDAGQPVGGAGKPVEPAGNQQIALDIAFRVIADHIRTLSFAIADGIQPGNNDRNYVLRRILRRAVRYGRTLGFKEPFFYKLVDVLADTMGDVFPEIRARKQQVQETIQREEEAFNKTLDTGISLFVKAVEFGEKFDSARPDKSILSTAETRDQGVQGGMVVLKKIKTAMGETVTGISGELAFLLYDTYGFPLDLTELMARERGLTVDKEGFEKLMEAQRARARAAQKKEVVSLSQIETTTPTQFVGYEELAVQAKVLEVVSLKNKTAVILNTSACYAEMGGQVGDAGELNCDGNLWRVTNTQKSGNTFLHFLADSRSDAPRSESVPERGALLRELDIPVIGSTVTLTVEKARRDAIQRHHTVTHLLHWALHEVVSKEASQKGSFVGPDKLTFDFNSAPLTPQQFADIEKLVNERILENTGVSWTEVPYADVKSRKDVMQFFGDKYGDTVRVVQIGGHAAKLDGYSMELCGGTHTRATGEIGLFRIVGESAIAAGVRRIEAVAGLEAYRKANDELHLIKTLAGKVNSPVHELDKKIEAMLAHQKELEKLVKAAQQREASNAASLLLEEVKVINGVPVIIHNLGSAAGDFLQAIADSLKGRFKGVMVLGGAADGAVSLLAAVSPDFQHDFQAGKIIQQIAPIVGGKGGGKPDNARGGGKDATKLDEALAKAKSLLG